MPKMINLARRLWSNSVTRQVHFDRKIPNLKNWNVYFCILEYYGHFRHFKRDKQMDSGNDEDCRIWESSLTIIGLQSRRAIVMLLSSLLWDDDSNQIQQLLRWNKLIMRYFDLKQMHSKVVPQFTGVLKWS